MVEQHPHKQACVSMSFCLIYELASKTILKDKI